MRRWNPLDTRCLGVPACLTQTDIRLAAPELVSREPTRIGGVSGESSLANAGVCSHPGQALRICAAALRQISRPAWAAVFEFVLWTISEDKLVNSL